MSLLAELEELQRCLEGTADSDSEDESNLEAPTADSKTSEKEDVLSLANKNKGERTSLVPDTVVKYPLHAETVCKSDKTGSAAQVSRVQTSSQESSANKGHTSKSFRHEVTTVDMVTMKNVLPESGRMQGNISRGLAYGKLSRDKILADVCTKKDFPSKGLEISTLRQDELKAPSKLEEVKILTCKVPVISALNKGSTSTDSLHTSVSKMEGESQVSESKTVPISSLALANEDALIFEELKMEGVADVNRSPFQTEEDPSKLQINANKPTTTARQAQAIFSATSRSGEVKLPSVPSKVCASDAGPVVGSKSKNESSTRLQAPHKAFRPCVNSTANKKLSLDSDRHTSERVQPAPSSSVFNVDSKASTLEEVRISNKIPVIRVMSVSSDSKKIKSETAGVSVSSPASLSIIRRGNVSRQGGPANSPPGATKRNISFETGSAVGQTLGEKQPTVIIHTYKQKNLKQLKKNEEGTDVKKRKLSADVSLSVSTAMSQHVPEMSEPTVKQKLCDISVMEGNVRVDSECLLQKNVRVHQDSEGKDKQEFCSKLGLETGMDAEASQAVAVGKPVLRKRRAMSDPLASSDVNKSKGFSLPGGKRRKLSVSEISGLSEETLNSESAGSVTMAQSFPNKRVPIASAVEVAISPQGFDQSLQLKSEDEQEVKYEAMEVEKEDPGKQFMKAKVVLKKLNIPVPEHLLPLPVQDAKTAKTKPQTLQKTLERVSKMLQVTLTESSPLKRRKAGRPRKLQDGLVEPVKGQNIMKRPVLQPKVIRKPSKQKIVGKQDQQKVIGRQIQQKIIRKASQQKITGKPSKHKYAGEPKRQKTVGKSSKQKLAAESKQQKTVRKPVRQQRIVSKPKTIQKTSSSNRPSIAIRIASKNKKVVPKTVVASKNKTKSERLVPRKSKTKLQKVVSSIIAKKTIKQVSFKNLKYKQSMKSKVHRRPEGKKKKNEAVKDKNVTLNRSKQNKVQAKEKRIVLKKNTKEPSRVRENEVVQLPAVKAAKTFQQKKSAAMNRLPEPKKVVTVDKKLKKSQQVAVKSGKPDGYSTGADDEWIVEVLLDDSEIDMMTLNSQVKVGQDANISKVSSSDDRPKDLHVSTSDLDTSHSLECDSSTDMNRRKTILGAGKNVRRNICDNESNTDLNTHRKQEVGLPSVNQVTHSFSVDKRTGISAEQKMAEMRKAIGDLERIADRSMLRLKAEERQVVYLTNTLHEYENDKHHIMLRKILRDAAPGPKQNPHAEFILDLVLSYCPEDDDSDSREMLQAPDGSSFQSEED